MSLERQTDSNVSIHQYESVRSGEMDDPRLTHAKSGYRLDMRQPLVTGGSSTGSKRFQKFDQVGFLSRCEVQRKQLVVVIDHRQEIWRTAIMEVWWMLPEPA
jgi:hypothetical protein